MKRRLIISALFAVNAVLIGLLISGRPNRSAPAAVSSDTDAAPETQAPDQPSNVAPSRPAAIHAPATPFTKVYSTDSKAFAANLRSIGCPELTIKDILAADIHQRYHEREAALRPKPADHVPFMWSAGTSEARLIERRQQAAALAKEESALLSDALGHEVTIQMPLYAMRSSDVQFASALATLPEEKQAAGRAADNAYWAGVQTLEAKTKGFWLPDDVAELNQLKAARQQALLPLVREQ